MKRCQRCGERRDDWTIHEARIEVGEVAWKLQLCRDCTDAVERAVLFVGQMPPREGEKKP